MPGSFGWHVSDDDGLAGDYIPRERIGLCPVVQEFPFFLPCPDLLEFGPKPRVVALKHAANLPTDLPNERTDRWNDGGLICLDYGAKVYEHLEASIQGTD